MQRTCKHLLILIAILLAACTKSEDFNLNSVIQSRPESHKVVFDYVGLMLDVEESATRYLNTIRNQYQIEILIAAIPSLHQQFTVNEAAAKIFSSWNIGSDYQSRGILLLLVDDVQEVKLEVGFELEDVFTDRFTGHIEQIQLPAYYRAGNLEIGLISLLEALEARAQVKFNDSYNHADIAGLDTTYLSQGAGARLALNSTQTQAEFSGTVNRNYPAGETPEATWQVMIQRWADKARDPYLEVFTPLTRLAYRDFTNMPNARFEKSYRTYARKEYQILENGDYAVVYFGKMKGWDNAPFLLCRTRQGWQFDMVHQRRFIRMGRAPDWGVEFGEHPHMSLLMDSFQFRGQDIPLEGEDLYTIEQDTHLANQIVAYEAAHTSDPQDFDAALTLGRLYTMTAMSRKGISILKKAQQMAPDNPLPYKYLAIGHVCAHYQYDAALSALQAYLAHVPRDGFGLNFLGYLHYCKKAYAKAAEAFKQALAVKPDNCYAHFYLAYTYAWLHKQTAKLDPRRGRYNKRHKYHVEQTRQYRGEHPLRVRKLDMWLSN